MCVVLVCVCARVRVGVCVCLGVVRVNVCVGASVYVPSAGLRQAAYQARVPAGPCPVCPPSTVVAARALSPASPWRSRAVAGSPHTRTHRPSQYRQAEARDRRGTGAGRASGPGRAGLGGRPWRGGEQGGGGQALRALWGGEALRAALWGGDALRGVGGGLV